MSDRKPTIQVAKDGPFLVKGLERLTDGDGNPVSVSTNVVALCRCGESANKPFCDGTHVGIGFSGKKERSETYATRRYDGKELGVADNIGICCHAGECVRGAPEVFFRWDGDERVSLPDEAERDKVLAVIRRCPSGSLLARLDGQVEEKFYQGQVPEILVSKDGPLHIRGEMRLEDPDGAKPVTEDHYTLCRCGASKNKPFCDGAHKQAGFKG